MKKNKTPIINSNVNAEQSIIATLLVDSSYLPALIDKLLPEHFTNIECQHIYETMLSLHNRGLPIDQTMIESNINPQYQSAIYELFRFLNSRVIKSENITYYADDVIKCANHRERYQLAEKLKASTLDDEELQNTINSLQKLINNQKPLNLRPTPIFSLADSINNVYPDIQYLLYPFFSRPGVSMIFAGTGMGKSNFAMEVAYAVAGGDEFLGKKIAEALGVLYFDAEMNIATCIKRFKSIHKRKQNLKALSNLKIFSRNHSKITLDLTNPLDRKQLEDWITDDIKVLILDNLSALMLSGNENDAEVWQPVRKWLEHLTGKGITVIFIHHANKLGGQSGTSARERLNDTILEIKRPENWERVKHGEMINLKMLKGRDVPPEHYEELTLHYTSEKGFEVISNPCIKSTSKPKKENEIETPYQIIDRMRDQGHGRPKILAYLVKNVGRDWTDYRLQQYLKSDEDPY